MAASPLPDHASKRWFAVIIGGLLCSNCCILQLLLNSMGIGCAGFAILSPFRWHFFLVTSAALLMLRTPGTTSRAFAWFIQAVLFGFLVAMPEVISIYSAGGYSFFDDSGNAFPSAALLVRVIGMKCAACGERARTLSLSVPCVQTSSVKWERGHIKLQLLSGSDVIECGQSVSIVLKQAGFEIMTLESCAESVWKQGSSLFSFWSPIAPRHPDATLMGNCSSMFMH